MKERVQEEGLWIWLTTGLECGIGHVMRPQGVGELAVDWSASKKVHRHVKGN